MRDEGGPNRLLPSVLESGLKALASSSRQMVLLELRKREQLSFNELVGATGLNRGTLSRHLAELEKGGLVTNYYQRFTNRQVYSFYEVTQFGSSLLDAVIGVVRAHKKTGISWPLGEIEPAYDLIEAEQTPTFQQTLPPSRSERRPIGGDTTLEGRNAYIGGNAGETH